VNANAELNKKQSPVLLHGAVTHKTLLMKLLTLWPGRPHQETVEHCSLDIGAIKQATERLVKSLQLCFN